jgi:undecaprenyl-diphosphatase
MSDTVPVQSLVLPHWQRLDRRLFLWMGAGHQAQPRPLVVAKRVARWSWVPLLGLMAAGLPHDARGIAVLGQCLLVSTVVQVASKRLSRHWCSSRPFMEGLSPNHLNHSARAGFPSTHATVMGAVLGFMLLQMPPGPALAGIAAVTLGTGWARVYAGAHYPLDVLAGLLLGGGAGLSMAAAIGKA